MPAADFKSRFEWRADIQGGPEAIPRVGAPCDVMGAGESWSAPGAADRGRLNISVDSNL